MRGTPFSQVGWHDYLLFDQWLIRWVNPTGTDW